MVERQESYAALYERFAAGGRGREVAFDVHTPMTFQQSGLDMPFPVPRLVYRGLQRRWEAHSDLHFGPAFEGWVEASVQVRDYRLFPRRVHFKGMRGAPLTASVGEFRLALTRPGDLEPLAARLLAEYANYAGIGYKTTYGLGHVTAEVGI